MMGFEDHSRSACSVVSRRHALSEVGIAGFRKPQVILPVAVGIPANCYSSLALKSLSLRPIALMSDRVAGPMVKSFPLVSEGSQ